MLGLLPLAQTYSHAPISNFFVGVVVRGASGSLYLGANIEISGQCLGFAVHAEQSALSNAYMNSEQSVTSLAVAGGAPCGHCRQFMEEISPAGEILILIPNQPPVKLASILPAAFGPAALGATQGALPIRKVKLALSGGASDALNAAALDAACRSYAPYSKSPAGVAIRTTGGRIFQGCYIENVAFNPSLSPLQTAVVQLIAAGQAYSAISAVTLVEDAGLKDQPASGHGDGTRRASSAGQAGSGSGKGMRSLTSCWCKLLANNRHCTNYAPKPTPPEGQ